VIAFIIWVVTFNIISSFTGGEIPDLYVLSFLVFCSSAVTISYLVIAFQSSMDNLNLKKDIKNSKRLNLSRIIKQEEVRNQYRKDHGG